MFIVLMNKDTFLKYLLNFSFLQIWFSEKAKNRYMYKSTASPYERHTVVWIISRQHDPAKKACAEPSMLDLHCFICPSVKKVIGKQ